MRSKLTPVQTRFSIGAKRTALSVPSAFAVDHTVCQTTDIYVIPAGEVEINQFHISSHPRHDKPENLCQTPALRPLISRVGFEAVGDVPKLNLPRGCADGTGRVGEENLLLRLAHQPEKFAGLRVVVGVLAVIPDQ